MQRIILTDEDADHIKAWQKLPSESKEALNKMAKLMSDEGKRKSFYTLLEQQMEISNIVAAANHMGWLGRMFLKAGAIASVLIAIAACVKLYIGSK